LLSALAVTIVTALDPGGLTAHYSPVVGGIALALWAAVLGLAAILIGTLCDERAAVVDELHEAYVGIVEVLSKYLQSGNPRVKAGSIRVAELTQLIGTEMKLPRKHLDEIRVGALLHDLGNVEITTRMIARAVDKLETSPSRGDRHTFAGLDLVHSLGSVLHGTVPLLLGQDDSIRGQEDPEDDRLHRDTPFGAKIIRLARAYDALTGGGPDQPKASPEHALDELRRDPSGEHDETLLRALERVVRRSGNEPRAAAPAEVSAV
jgi:response regulator RpfG family c-di-GMP phosphodiesterase